MLFQGVKVRSLGFRVFAVQLDLTTKFRTPHSALRIPHSAFRTPHSALRIPHSAFRTPHSALRIPHSALRIPHSAFPLTRHSQAGYMRLRRRSV
jgi:hypothetical protein